MAKWRPYRKAETEEDRKTFLQKKVTAIAEEKNTKRSRSSFDYKRTKNGLRLKSR
jgi:hypothetical protein